MYIVVDYCKFQLSGLHTFFFFNNKNLNELNYSEVNKERGENEKLCIVVVVGGQVQGEQDEKGDLLMPILFCQDSVLKHARAGCQSRTDQQNFFISQKA